MPIQGDYQSFTPERIEGAPAQPGVYQLDTMPDIIYYGSSTISIRDRLRSHYAGNEGPCTQRAQFFKTEVNAAPLGRERELLQEYYNGHGRLPACNDVTP